MMSCFSLPTTGRMTEHVIVYEQPQYVDKEKSLWVDVEYLGDIGS